MWDFFFEFCALGTVVWTKHDPCACGDVVSLGWAMVHVDGCRLFQTSSAMWDAAASWFGPSHYRLLISLVSERQLSIDPRSASQRPSQLADARWIHWDSGMISPIWFPYVFHLEQSNKLTTLLRSEIIHLILYGYFFMDNEVHPRKPFFLEKWIALSSASKRHVKEIPILRVG